MAVMVVAGRGEDRDRTVRLVVAHQPVIRDIRPDQVLAGRKIGRALRPAASLGKFLDVHVAHGQATEAIVIDNVILGEHVPSSNCSRLRMGWSIGQRTFAARAQHRAGRSYPCIDRLFTERRLSKKPQATEVWCSANEGRPTMTKVLVLYYSAYG